MSQHETIGETAALHARSHEESRNRVVLALSAAPSFGRPANVRPAYQNTSDAMDIAVKALQLAASNARMEGAPPALIEKLTSQAARLSAVRLEVMKGNPA